MHTSIGFNPSGKTLVVTLVSNSFVCYDVEKKGLSEWYRKHHEQFPAALVDGKQVKGMAFDPAHPDFLYLYSHSTLYQINTSPVQEEPNEPNEPKAQVLSQKKTSKRTPEKKKAESESEAESRKQEQQKEEKPGFCKVINRYRPLSFVDFVAENEMVVVETPWLKVLSRLPGTLQRHKYGK
jgi:U3 small nucleolar RNA-associated protein 4